jgi:hypothetical protein
VKLAGDSGPVPSCAEDAGAAKTTASTTATRSDIIQRWRQLVRAEPMRISSDRLVLICGEDVGVDLVAG